MTTPFYWVEMTLDVSSIDKKPIELALELVGELEGAYDGQVVFTTRPGHVNLAITYRGDAHPLDIPPIVGGAVRAALQGLGYATPGWEPITFDDVHVKMLHRDSDVETDLRAVMC